MKKQLSRTLALLLTLAMLLALFACGGQPAASEPAAPAEEAAAAEPAAPSEPEVELETAAESAGPSHTDGVQRTLSIGTFSDAFYTMQFDPFGYVTPAAASPTAFSALIWDHPFNLVKNGVFSSDILESYEWSEDGLTLTMTLKKGILFTNGEEMSAEDILWSIGQYKASKTCFLSAFYQAFDIENSTVSEDGYTAYLKCAFVYGSAMTFLAQVAILNKDWFDAAGGSWESIDVFDPTQVCGSGPYTCTMFIPQTTATYTLREDYWGFEQGVTWPVYNEIKGYYYTDQTTMAVDLETGKLDIATNLSQQDYTRLSGGEVAGYTAYGVDSNSVVFIAIGDQNEYLQDPIVREAICHAIDAAAVTEAAVGPLGKVADSILGTSQAGYAAGFGYNYDPELSKKLLADAGYTDGQITLKYAVMADAIQQNTAEAVQFYLSEIGIGLEIVTYDRAGWYAAMGAPDFTDFIWYQLSGGSPDGDPGRGSAQYWQSTSTLVYYPNRDVYDESLGGGSHVLTLEEKAPFYAQFQQAVHDNFDAIPLYQYLTAVGYNTATVQEIPFQTVGCWPQLIVPVANPRCRGGGGALSGSPHPSASAHRKAVQATCSNSVSSVFSG